MFAVRGSAQHLRRLHIYITRPEGMRPSRGDQIRCFFVTYHYPPQSYRDLLEDLHRRTPALSKVAERTL
jgi:hypothetical protein